MADFDAALRRNDEEGWRRAAELYAQPLVVECREEWIAPERERRAAEAAQALARLSEAVDKAGRTAEALSWYRRLLAIDPYNEDAVRGQMRALASMGQTEEAKGVYEAYVRRLRNDLGLEPSAELRVALGNVVAPSRPAIAVPRQGGVPSFSDALIGRELEKAQAREGLLRREIVTLVGPGGVGKTRMAAWLAEEHGARFPDGAWFVHLVEVRDSEGVLEAVAAALRPIDPRPSEGAGGLPARLADRAALIVLDNCEHVSEGARKFVREIVRQAPACQIAATSQCPLQVRGERLVRLAPLSVPKLDESRASVLLEHEAVRLFLERAPAVRAKRASDLQLVAAICRRLDGLPLAIELAARRTAYLPLSQMADLLEDRFRVLVGRNPDPRHGTLSAAIRWSYDHLPAPERRALRAISVFRGAFCPVIASKALDRDPIETAELLEALVERSLLTSVGAREFRLLESVRWFAFDELGQEGEREETLDRLVEALIGLAAKAERRDASESIYALIDRHSEDVSVVIDRALAHSERLLGGLMVANRLSLYWSTRCRIAYSSRVLQAFLNACESQPDVPRIERARLLVSLGGQLTFTEPVRAELYSWEGLRLAQEEGDLEYELQALTRLSLILDLRGNYPEARRCIGQALERMPADAEPATRAFFLSQSGRLLLEECRFEEAIATYSAAIAFCDDQQVGNRATVARGHLARLHTELGNHDLAERLLDRAFEWYADNPHPSLLAFTKGYRGRLEAERGHLAASRRWYAEAFHDFTSLNVPRGLLLTMRSAIALCALAGDHRRALWLYGATVELRRRVGQSAPTPFHRLQRRPWTRRAIAALGPDARRAFREGRNAADPVAEFLVWLEAPVGVRS